MRRLATCWVTGVAGLVAASGGVAALAQGVAPAAMDLAATASLMDEGARVFRNNCVACHGADGNGVNAPALAGDARLASIRVIATQIIFGGADMPAFDGLTDRQVAAVATYIRRSWGNTFDPVGEEAIANYR